MKIPELIAHLLELIGRQFYDGRPREFRRDERALTKAISRYGYECAQRGWTFEVEFIQRDMMGVLISMRDKQAEIKYLPLYLESAMTRHIGQRAEELQAKAKTSASKVSKIVEKTKGVIVIEPTNTEILGAVYSDLRRAKRANKATKKKTPDRQGALL